jgi:hypothetical protein
MLTNREMEVLKDFDLATKYGPGADITRLARWRRAEKFNLAPPKEVLEILERIPKDSTDQCSVLCKPAYGYNPKRVLATQ